MARFAEFISSTSPSISSTRLSSKAPASEARRNASAVQMSGWGSLTVSRVAVIRSAPSQNCSVNLLNAYQRHEVSHTFINQERWFVPHTYLIAPEALSCPLSLKKPFRFPVSLTAPSEGDYRCGSKRPNHVRRPSEVRRRLDGSQSGTCPISGLIGVHGKVSGFLTVNMAERSAIKLVEGLLGEKSGTLTPQIVDGAGEITNIIVGGIKSMLTGSTWSFSHITVPSVIIGKGYQIAYAKGLDFVLRNFERTDPEAILLEDRLFHVSVSLLRL